MTAARRALVCLGALALLGAACAGPTPSATDPGRDGNTPLPGRSATASEPASPTARASSIGRPASGEPSTHPGGAVRATIDDDGRVGSAAAAYLRADPAGRLTVEVDYVRGRAPTTSALEHLTAILRRELRKPDGITVEVDDEIGDRASSRSVRDIRALERRYRDARSSDGRATMWIVYLDGTLEEEQSALGVAFHATGAALFPDQIRSAATTLIRPAAIERATLTHEAGHLLGLVNLVISSAYDHEDPEHPGHSRYRDSVMYWAIEDVSIASLLTGGPPDDFDRYDRADLAAIRGA